MKHLPNALTVLRLALSLLMFFALAVIGVGLSGGGGISPEPG